MLIRNVVRNEKFLNEKEKAYHCKFGSRKMIRHGTEFRHKEMLQINKTWIYILCFESTCFPKFIERAYEVKISQKKP